MTTWVAIPGGAYLLGSDTHEPEEAPVHRVTVDPFEIDASPVTNEAFARFVDATGYVTVAERPLDPAAYPGAPIENLVPGSMVFVPTPGPVDLRHLSQWWVWMPGAAWHSPEGPGSGLRGRLDHPVVHVAFEDAAAYASWAGVALPSEAEWEVAARGGLEAMPFTWGELPERPGERLANYFHGDFPWRAAPGYGRTTPVGSFPPNGFGLVDMAGNVWEWTTDWYTDRRLVGDSGPCCAQRDPRGGTEAASIDARLGHLAVPRRVIKGGSFLCADSYCRRYRPAARRPQAVDTGMSHVGFRCVRRIVG